MRHMLLNARQAAEQLRQGKVIAYPTEAVFGLGCDPSNERAVRSLLSLKHRPESAGLILVGASFTQFGGWVGDLTDEAIKPALETWPGPVTWLFPRGPKTADFISGSRDTVAIRVTGHRASTELCMAFGGPLVSTSANPRSAPPARSSGEVEDYFGAYIGGILEGALGGNERPSEIRDLATGKVIRPAG
ncbi:MAG: Sua5/YciO/YrdC/YwlC family protein [Gammaproteobacteria bacterium]|nr:Sua5/YciO/YrdC/YwlC family protein [Gammaproteobacteria bacterium]NNE06899.1 tRNA threonylcarbamoyladenosine biosynthesis protein RimN [Xanthomonadales bacterium]